MKTLTIRLDDYTAEALERLAYINGLSQNKLINALIAKEYGNTSAQCWARGGELFAMDDAVDVAFSVEEMFHSKYDRPPIEAPAPFGEGTMLLSGFVITDLDDHEFMQLLRAYDYSIEKATEAGDKAQIEALNEGRERILANFSECALEERGRRTITMDRNLSDDKLTF